MLATCTSIQIALLFACVKAQAPGDGAATSQIDGAVYDAIYEQYRTANGLFYDYVELLSSPPGTWNSLDVDGDGHTVSVPEV